MKKNLLCLALLLTGALQAQTINIPDATFKERLLTFPDYSTAIDINGDPMVVDANNDGEIQVSEALEVYELSLADAILIQNLTGIEYFTNLRALDCSYNQIVALDVSMLSNLETLGCSHNNLISVNVTNLVNLKSFYCYSNNLTQINLSGVTSLTNFWCYSNNLTSLTIENKPLLEIVKASNNEMTEITAANLPLLNLLECNYNYLTSLDFSNVPGNFEVLVSNNAGLEYMNLKNGVGKIYPTAVTTGLEFICVDSNEVDFYVDYMEYYNIPNLVISSYCTFTPGGNFNTIIGTVTFDYDNNGCDDQDYLSDFIKIKANDGTNAAANFTNASGQYSLYTQGGAITVTPAVENPDYFTVTPASAVVNFASANDLQAVQNFCITANGVHPDAEVVVVPIIMAQPGFDAQYKIVYKNKGNQVLNGNVTFIYIDSALDYVSSTPAIDTQSDNNLTWNFVNLLPFEEREILLTLNLNGPMETPPIFNGDTIYYNAVIDGGTTDETPADNLFVLNQVVNGSFDPNDITCLEGDFVAPDMIGEYLHYNINFENNGTAAATFIVVKDEIDTTKFNVSSLQVLNASHDVEVRITGNVAEFIFNDINLGAAQKGNIAFKIKSLNTLQVDDIVANDADIYFDYNFPVATNEAETTFQVLSVADNVRDASVKVYPNPSKAVVNIKADSSLQSIELFDVQGRLLQTAIVNDVTYAVDIASRQVGVYFLKVITSKGSKVEKIVKN